MKHEIFLSTFISKILPHVRYRSSCLTYIAAQSDGFLHPRVTHDGAQGSSHSGSWSSFLCSSPGGGAVTHCGRLPDSIPGLRGGGDVAERVWEPECPRVGAHFLQEGPCVGPLLVRQPPTSSLAGLPRPRPSQARRPGLVCAPPSARAQGPADRDACGSLSCLSNWKQRQRVGMCCPGQSWSLAAPGPGARHPAASAPAPGPLPLQIRADALSIAGHLVQGVVLSRCEGQSSLGVGFECSFSLRLVKDRALIFWAARVTFHVLLGGGFPVDSFVEISCLCTFLQKAFNI